MVAVEYSPVPHICQPLPETPDPGMHRLQVMLMQHGDTATIFAKRTPQTEIRPGMHCFNALLQSKIRHGPHQAVQGCFLVGSLLWGPACNRSA